jgi:hypothetical protein
MYAQTREKVSDVKSTAAAAVFLATKECKCERTIKEINKVVDPTRKLKNAVGKASRELNRVMQERLQVGCPAAAEVYDACSLLLCCVPTAVAVHPWPSLSCCLSSAKVSNEKVN